MIRLNRVSLVIVFISSVFLFGCKEDESLTTQEQFDLELAIIDQFLSDNNIDAKIDANSGIRYVTHEQGTGLFSNSGNDIIKINYEGRLLSGEVFDSGQEIEFILGSLIIGWQEGLPLIQEGGSITLYIPSAYAYGTSGQGSIPPNSTLIFDIDLIEIICNQTNDVSIEEEQNALDIAEIDTYLMDNGIQAIEHETGIRYVVNQEGNGLTAKLCDDVTINYEARLLSDNSVVGDAENITFSLLNSLTIAWQILLTELPSGTSVTLYVPSGYAYGTEGSTNIPPNANIIFELDLVDVQ